MRIDICMASKTLRVSVQAEISTVGTTFTVPTEALKIKLIALGPQRQGRVISVSLSSPQNRVPAKFSCDLQSHISQHRRSSGGRGLAGAAFNDVAIVDLAQSDADRLMLQCAAHKMDAWCMDSTRWMQDGCRTFFCSTVEP